MKRALAVLLVVGSVSLSACGHKNQSKDELLKAVHATQRRSGLFDYLDERAKRSIHVVGVSEDDFRYKAEVSINGQDGFDEVVDDDALAVRFLDPAQLPAFVDKTAVQTAKPATDVDGVTVTDALRAHRWVIDATGAPVATQSKRPVIGADPVLDARTALDYVEQSVTEALGVKKWDKDTIEPAYPSSEDVFPKPDRQSGVTRYDLVRPPLPPPGDITGAAGQQALAATKNFRKMAIYVKRGHVIRVIERVELVGKGLQSFITYMRTLLKEIKAPERDRQQFEKDVRTMPDKQLGPNLLGEMNSIIAARGLPPILVRAMTLDLRDTGLREQIALPTEDTLHGSLVFLVPAGGKKPSGTAGSAGSAGTTAAASPDQQQSTTTTSAGG